jgi:hypothetical protein
MRRYLAIAAAIAALAGLAQPGHAQPRGAKEAAERRVALAPLATLGSEATSRETKVAEKAIAAGVAALPDTILVDMTELRRAVRRAKKPRLRACDGEPRCLAELGKLVGASSVVYGEIGGLGDVHVVYLKLVSAADSREVRSTTLEFGDESAADAAARAAAFRLLAPELYTGRLDVEVDVKRASIFVDGKLMAKSPTEPISLPVGTHALRVTHPEYRDYVRFVKIEFDADEKVDAGLQQYPVIRSSLKSDPGKKVPVGSSVVYRGVEPTPWYRRWYSVAGGGALVLLGSAVIVGILANGIDADGEKTVGEE